MWPTPCLQRSIRLSPARDCHRTPLSSVGDDVVSMGRAGGHAVFFVGDAGSQVVRDVADALSPAVYSALSGA